jgi:hypothetical protein
MTKKYPVERSPRLLQFMDYIRRITKPSKIDDAEPGSSNFLFRWERMMQNVQKYLLTPR